jgi:hypothetical protein
MADRAPTALGFVTFGIVTGCALHANTHAPLQRQQLESNKTKIILWYLALLANFFPQALQLRNRPGRLTTRRLAIQVWRCHKYELMCTWKEPLHFSQCNPKTIDSMGETTRDPFCVLKEAWPTLISSNLCIYT